MAFVNMIISPSGEIMLIDWDGGGFGHPMFDLGEMLMWAEETEPTCVIALEHYYGSLTPTEMKQRLTEVHSFQAIAALRLVTECLETDLDPFYHVTPDEFTEGGSARTDSGSHRTRGVAPAPIRGGVGGVPASVPRVSHGLTRVAAQCAHSIDGFNVYPAASSLVSRSQRLLFAGCDKLTNEPMMSLAGKRALVTGSTMGIGYEAARGLLEADARVAIHGRDIKRVREAIHTLCHPARTVAVRGDVRDPAELVPALAPSLRAQGRD